MIVNVNVFSKTEFKTNQPQSGQPRAEKPKHDIKRVAAERKSEREMEIAFAYMSFPECELAPRRVLKSAAAEKFLEAAAKAEHPSIPSTSTSTLHPPASICTISLALSSRSWEIKAK